MRMHTPLLFYRRLVVVCLLWGIIVWISVSAGLLDLWYRHTAPAFLQTFPTHWAQFRAAARWNPCLQADRLYAWWIGTPSWYTVYITTSPTISVKMPAPLPVGSTPNAGVLLGQWLIAPHPLSYVPDPAAQLARQGETQALATIVHSYWWATQRGGLVLLAMVGVCGVVIQWQLRWQRRPRRPRLTRPVTLSLTDAVFAERLCTIDTPQRRAWGLPLARLVRTALPGSPTARALVRMFAAHATWPASIHHHGCAPGGLLAHTTTVLQQAIAHAGAQDAVLGRAFLLTALAHDIGKLQTYTPDETQGFVQTAVFHPNRSADLLLSIPAFQKEFPAALRTIIITALRCSAGRALTPVPLNAPLRVGELMTWLSEVDRAAVRAEVLDLTERLRAASITGCVERLLQAPAPTPDLLAPVYCDPETKQQYVVRSAARVVWLTVLGLHTHAGAYATVGRRDPVWEHLLQSLRAADMPIGDEQSMVVPGIGPRVRMVPLFPQSEHAVVDETRTADDTLDHTEGEEEE